MEGVLIAEFIMRTMVHEIISLKLSVLYRTFSSSDILTLLSISQRLAYIYIL